MKQKRSIAWALVILLLLETTVRFFGVGVGRLVINSDLGVYVDMDMKLKASTKSPTVVFLGSSRIRDAIAPRIIEQVTGYDEGSVLNLAISSGGPLEAFETYKLHRDQLKEAKLLVVGLDDWAFNSNHVNKTRLRVWASLLDRIMEPVSSELKADLILGYFSKIWDERAILNGYVQKIKDGSLFDSKPRRSLPVDSYGRVIANPKSQELLGVIDEQSSIDQADIFFKDYTLSPISLRYLKKLAQMAQEDNVKLVFLRVPTRQSYYSYVQLNYHNEDNLWKDEIAKQIPNVQLLDWENGVVDLSDNNFYDYGHATRVGAEKISYKTGQWINQYIKSHN